MTKTNCATKKPASRKSRANPQSEAAAERAVEAHKLYVQKFTIRQIGEKLGVSKTAVHNYLTEGRQRFRESIQHSQEERHAERYAGLVAILEEAWANYRSTSNLGALDLARKCESDLRKLFGDDAPTKQQTELSGELKGSVPFLSKEQLIADIKAAVERGNPGPLPH
ncbi:MAG: terminase gpP N-terminus-related DNA-binding protein [Pirellulaceae bacterium]